MPNDWRFDHIAHTGPNWPFYNALEQNGTSIEVTIGWKSLGDEWKLSLLESMHGIISTSQKWTEVEETRVPVCSAQFCEVGLMTLPLGRHAHLFQKFFAAILKQISEVRQRLAFRKRLGQGS